MKRPRRLDTMAIVTDDKTPVYNGTEAAALVGATAEVLADVTDVIAEMGRGTLTRKLQEANDEIKTKGERILKLERDNRSMRDLIDAIDREPKSALEMITRWRYRP